ncbi:MAG TPA: NYN domain-containing protein [Candidatus Saccharimonadales bacterium]|nr:NYN domain-containing protein [Candidatus Saccharimonadales bacterium]
MPYIAYGFVDGGYLRKLAENVRKPLVSPRRLVDRVVLSPNIQSWCSDPMTHRNVALARVIYYDARPDDDSEVEQDIKDYWDAIELLQDTELGFGSTRGGTKKRPPRQKGVDTLIAVDMLVGAFTKLFSVAVLVAGDADFVPVVNEVKRRGVMVAVAAAQDSLSDDLKRAADRFFRIDLLSEADFPALQVEGRSWKTV